MSRAYSTAIQVLVAFWPIWSWYVQRTFDRSDEPLGLLALLSLIALNYFRSSDAGSPTALNSRKTDQASSSGPEVVTCSESVTAQNGVSSGSASRSAACKNDSDSALPIGALVSSCILFAIYITTFPFVPKVFSAGLAVLITSFVANRVLKICRFAPGDWLLALLSLPVVASLNFFIGFPLRVFVTVVACFLLRISGLAVDASGTELLFSGQTVEVDAPCSGIKMLWFSFYLAATFASYYVLPFRYAVALLPVALAAALLGNIMRVTSLFYVETGLISVASYGADPHFVHEATGVSAFLFQGLLIYFVSHFFASRALSAASQKVESIDSGAEQSVSGAETKVPNEKSKLSVAHLSKYQMLSGFLYILCLVSAGLPFYGGGTVAGVDSSADFPGWPKEIFGLELKQLPASAQDEMFLQGFPGRAARFQSGGAQIVFRWVNHESLQVHPSSDCYKGTGYDVTLLPVLIDGSGNRWRHFMAKKGTEELEIKELIFDQKSQSWSDVSSWYWDASTKKSHGPWWVVTIIEPRTPLR